MAVGESFNLNVLLLETLPSLAENAHAPAVLALPPSSDHLRQLPQNPCTQSYRFEHLPLKSYSL
jgi:hypothetical protein